jgi:IS605 OrfB family transposase
MKPQIAPSVPNIVQRTVTLHLPPNDVLAETVRQFNECCNFFIELGFKAQTYSKKDLQRLGYYEARARWPHLQSSLVQGARDCAHDMLRRERLTRLPKKRSMSSARFNHRTFTPFLRSSELSMSTVQGRVRVPFVLPEYFRRYIDGYVTALRLRIVDGRPIVDLVMDLPDQHHRQAVDPVVLGVDRGIINIAVTSSGRFFHSKELRSLQSRYAFLRARLQAVGTRSAKRHLARLAGRERRFQADSNHRIAKSIAGLGFDVLALESLTVRKQRRNGRAFNRKLGRWAFGQFGSFLTYKCQDVGKSVVLVSPEYTSQDCSRCGARGARVGRAFSCLRCGFRLHADLNAARNIAQRGSALLGRRTVNPPIVARHEIKPRNLVERSYKPPALLGCS